MPGPKFRHFNIIDNLRIMNYSGCISFGDNDLYISSSADGTLNIGGDTGVTIKSTTVTLDGNTTLTTGDTFTVSDGAVNLGTGEVTISGNIVLSDGKYLQTSPGAESFRFPNDGTVASGQWNNSSNTMWKTQLISSNVCGWLRVKVASGSNQTSWQTMYAPLFSSTSWAT